MNWKLKKCKTIMHMARAAALGRPGEEHFLDHIGSMLADVVPEFRDTWETYKAAQPLKKESSDHSRVDLYDANRTNHMGGTWCVGVMLNPEQADVTWEKYKENLIWG